MSSAQLGPVDSLQLMAAVTEFGHGTIEHQCLRDPNRALAKWTHQFAFGGLSPFSVILKEIRENCPKHIDWMI
jgi:hypothetical protein